MAFVLASSSTSTLVFSRQSGFASRNSFAKTDYNNRVLRFPVKRNPTLTCLRAQSDDSTTTSDHDTMKNKKHKDEGVFAATVVVLRNIIGKKRFNQLRGKAIALHSQVITDFCNYIGVDSKQRQGLIRLAKKNGEKLGFLA